LSVDIFQGAEADVVSILKTLADITRTVAAFKQAIEEAKAEARKEAKAEANEAKEEARKAVAEARKEAKAEAKKAKAKAENATAEARKTANSLSVIMKSLYVPLVVSVCSKRLIRELKELGPPEELTFNEQKQAVKDIVEGAKHFARIHMPSRAAMLKWGDGVGLSFPYIRTFVAIIPSPQWPRAARNGTNTLPHPSAPPHTIPASQVHAT
jgi:vacuolar-type H+-ATPase subunit H